MKNRLIYFFAVLQFSGLLKNGWPQETQSGSAFGFAQKLYEDKLFVLAGEQFQEFAAKYPSDDKSDDALLLSGKAYFEAKEFQKAFEALKQLEISYPQSPLLAESRFRLAQCVSEQKRFLDAAELFKRVPNFHHESEWAVRAAFESGRAFLKGGNRPAAREAFFTVINTYPDAPERLDAHLEIVQIYFDTGDYNEAINHIDGVFRAFGADFKDPRIYLLRAAAFEKLGQPGEAEAIYLNLLKQFPTHKSAQRANYHLGELYQNKGEFEKASAYFDKFLAAAPDEESLMQANLKKGDLLYSQNKFAEALKNYQQAAALASDQLKSEIDLKMASALHQIGEYDATAKLLKTIISREAGNEAIPLVQNAYKELIEVSVASKSFREALNLIQDYSVRFSESAQVSRLFFKRAQIYDTHLEDYTRALRAYDDFIEKFPFDPQVDEAQFAIAGCYERLGDYRLALREFENYHARYPAGDDFDAAKQHAEIISTTINFNPGGAMTNFSDLLARANRDHDSVNWHVELGKVHFDAKNFESAVSNFRKGQLGGDENIREQANYFLARAFFNLALKQQLSGEYQNAASHLDSAAVILKHLISSSNDLQRIDEAYYWLTRVQAIKSQISVSGPLRLEEIFDEWEKRIANSKYADLILINSANALTGADKNKTALEQAVKMYRKIPSACPFYEEAQFKEAVALTYLGSDSAAAKKLQTFILEYPKSQFIATALFIKAKVERKHEKFNSAIESLKRIQSEFFYSRWALEAQKELAEIYFQTGDYQSALDSYQNSHVNFTDEFGNDGAVNQADAAFNLARAHDHLGHGEVALQNYVAFIHEHPNHAKLPEAMLAVARLAQKQNNSDFASAYYQALLNHASQPQYIYEAHTALGDLFFKQELYSDARSHYLAASEQAVDISEKEYAARQAIRCRYYLRQFAAADAEAEQFKKQFKNSKDAEAQFLADKGHAYIAEKNFELAEKAFKKLKGDFKSSEWAAQGDFGLGAVYLITNHTEDALKILTDIPSKYPDSEVTPLTYFNLGDFYYKNQQIENAIGAFKRILTHPKSGKYHRLALSYLIKCYTDLNWWDQAIVATREYLDKYPTADDAFQKRIELAKFLMYLKEYVRAIEHFKELRPFADAESEPEIQFYIAQSYKEMGNFERATAEYLKVKYLTKPTKLPWQVTALFEASKCLISLGEIAQAKVILKRIISEEGTASNFGRFAVQKLEELEKDDSK